jgi:hypothetical protein
MYLDRPCKPRGGTFFFCAIHSPFMPRQIPPRQVETIVQAVGAFNNRVQEIPHFGEDIARWNAAWEAQFPSLNPGIGDFESLVGYLNPSKLEQMRFNNLRTLFRLQEELRVLAITSVLRPDFCWKISRRLQERCICSRDSCAHAWTNPNWCPWPGRTRAISRSHPWKPMTATDFSIS